MEKSRELSIDEYLKVLQLEYLTNKVRSLIFDRPEFVKMASDVAEFKKERIELLSKRHFKPSIFMSTEEFLNFYENEFLNPFGLPNFQYSNDNKKRASQWYWDVVHLLGKNQVVIYKDGEYPILGNNMKDQMVCIQIDKKRKNVKYSEIKIQKLVMCFDGKLL